MKEYIYSKNKILYKRVTQILNFFLKKIFFSNIKKKNFY